MSYAGKRILITGGFGFIGSNLAIELVKQGANVTIADNLSEFCGGNEFNVKEIKEKVEIKKLDISSKDAVPLIKEKEIIFNLAGHVSHIDSVRNPFIDYRINCEEQIKFLESCRKNNDSAAIVYAGTRAQYGRALYLPVDEKHPMNPVDVNGLNKLIAEEYHLLYNKTYGMKTASLRLTNVYGPRQCMQHSEHGFFNWFIRRAIEDATIKIFGDGKQLRDFNYVQDVVRAMLMTALNENGFGKVFNLGTGDPISILEAAKLIVEISRKGKIEVVHYPKEKRRIEVGDYYADISKIKSVIGWSPEIGLRQGIQKTIRFYIKNKGTYF